MDSYNWLILTETVFMFLRENLLYLLFASEFIINAYQQADELSTISASHVILFICVTECIQ